jgi:lipid-A-disaccharide synthase
MIAITMTCLVTLMIDKKILIFTGEHSGELLGARLVEAFKAKNPGCIVEAMGGEILKNAGASIILSNQGLDIIGFFEVFRHLPRLFRLWKTIKKTIQDSKPHLIILIDNPGLNLKIATFAKQLNIKVLYYVSPQIWAWKAGRIKRIQRDVDHMALLFPFEKTIYDQVKMPCTVVGHPMLNRFAHPIGQSLAQDQLGLNKNQKMVAILPGSRLSEIKRLMPVILKAAEKIHRSDPNLRMIIAQADSIADIVIPSTHLDYVSVIKQNTDCIVQASDAVICASGTATLEVALAQRPLVIIYKTSPLTYLLAKWLVKTPFVGLCNIVLQKFMVKELIQNEATAENIHNEVLLLLHDKTYRTAIENDLAQLSAKLGHTHQIEKLVQVIEHLLEIPKT